VSTGASEALLEGGGSGRELLQGGGEIVARSPLELFWSRLRRDRVALVALAFIVALTFVALVAPLLVKLFGIPGPNTQNPAALDQFGTPSGPTGTHLMGVDQLGRDVFARVLYGARVSLEVALLSTGIAVVFGTIAGMVAGFYRGWVDSLLSRLLDVMLGFPSLLLAIGLASACALGNGCLGGTLRPGLTVVVLVIALAAFPYIARIIRGQVLTLREKEYIEAARSLGASDRRIIFRDILPNLVAPIIVYSTLTVPTNILFEASLSFLGVGVQPPTASWGQMIGDAIGIFNDAWWYMFFPGVALVLTVLAFNLVGDGLQDALNPRQGR
jgi:peptide/nickel transport system permease protein